MLLGGKFVFFVVLHIPISLFSFSKIRFEWFEFECFCYTLFKQIISEVRDWVPKKFGFRIVHVVFLHSRSQASPQHNF